MIYAQLRGYQENSERWILYFFRRLDAANFKENFAFWDTYEQEGDSYMIKFADRVKQLAKELGVEDEEAFLYDNEQSMGLIYCFLAEDGFIPISETFFYKP